MYLALVLGAVLASATQKADVYGVRDGSSDRVLVGHVVYDPVDGTSNYAGNAADELGAISRLGIWNKESNILSGSFIPMVGALSRRAHSQKSKDSDSIVLFLDEQDKPWHMEYYRSHNVSQVALS